MSTPVVTEPSTGASQPPTDDTSDGTATNKVLGTDYADQTLTLNDFFNVDTSVWSENRYDVADRQQLRGISAVVYACGDTDERDQLELRLADNFSKLTFNVAQANDSESSDQRLVVEVTGNGQQLDVRRVPFNKIQPITLSVEGVNALKIALYLDDSDDDCYSQQVNAVIYDAQLHGSG